MAQEGVDGRDRLDRVGVCRPAVERRWAEVEAILRHRMAAEYYDGPAVLDEVARRILRSGHLRLIGT